MGYNPHWKWQGRSAVTHLIQADRRLHDCEILQVKPLPISGAKEPHLGGSWHERWEIQQINGDLRHILAASKLDNGELGAASQEYGHR